MGAWAQVGAAALQVGGGMLSDRSERKSTEADRKAQERLVRLSLQNERDMDREDWERQRALWRDAATAMSSFSHAPHLAERSQYSPTPQVNTAGTGFFDTAGGNRRGNGGG